MLPDDANPAGNVHGGTILKMIEMSGYIAATKHCNSTSSGGGGDGNSGAHAVVARIDHMDFWKPMFIGEVAKLEATVRFASAHSAEVVVTVEAENVVTGERRMTNRATLWYVAIGKDGKPRPVPPVEGLTADEEAAGWQRHARQKADRAGKAATEQRLAAGQGTTPSTPPTTPPTAPSPTSPGVAPFRTIQSSESQLVQLMLPSDCTKSGIVFGGVVMKLMDNAAGICALRHCRTNVVTASLDTLDCDAPIYNGDLLYVTARPIFASSKSMEIEVVVEAERVLSGERVRTNRGMLTFVRYVCGALEGGR